MAYMKGNKILFSPVVNIVDKYKQGFSDGYKQGFSDGYKDGENNYIKLQNIFDINSAIGGTDTTKFPTVILENWDNWWDTWQKNGTKTNYKSKNLKLDDVSFACWKSEYIMPKYPIAPTAAWAMFYKCQNLIEAPELDLSKVTDYTTSGTKGCNNLFDQCHKLQRVGVLDVRNTSLRAAFSECFELETIEKMLVSENTFFKNTFSSCYKLKNIRFEGILSPTRRDADYDGMTQQDYGFLWKLELSAATELSKESIISLFDCAKYSDGNIYNIYGSIVGNATIVLSYAAVNKAFETSKGANDGVNSEEWIYTISQSYSYYIALR